MSISPDADFNALNRKLLAMGATWSPSDDNGGKSTWNGDPADVPAGGGVGYEMNEIDVPDGHLAVIHDIVLEVGDGWDVAIGPGSYTEHWVYKGDAGVPYGDADWTQRVSDDDFLIHFGEGLNGIEDTASGTGGHSLEHSPPSLRMNPPRPILSATGQLSEAWEGDTLGEDDNNGEWAMVAYYDLIEAGRSQIIEELLEES